MDIPLLVLSSKGGEFIMLYTIIFLSAIPLLQSINPLAGHKLSIVVQLGAIGFTLTII